MQIEVFPTLLSLNIANLITLILNYIISGKEYYDKIKKIFFKNYLDDRASIFDQINNKLLVLSIWKNLTKTPVMKLMNRKKINFIKKVI